MDRHVALQATEAPNQIVSRILQLALGLFVTTVELPILPPDIASDPFIGYDCNFDKPCRWLTFGSTQDRWRLAKGEPDPFLWLAATGTMKIPKEPFSLIELRGQLADSFISDLIPCQLDSAHLSFTYWTIGNADLEICLLDGMNRRFNCTGMLNSRVQPGKVDLKVPAIQRPFRLSIIPNNGPGVLVLDDIRYDVVLCNVQIPTTSTLPPEPTTSQFRPRSSAEVIHPWTMPMPTLPPLLTSPPEIVPTLTSTPTTTTTTEPTTTTTISSKEIIASPEPPFNLLILGNKSTPLFDRRKNTIVENTNDLLCDFSQDFECRWGAEAGKWAIVKQGAIPSLVTDVPAGTELPVFPAAVVIQDTAMLSSDPLNCQNGSGKLLFRRWSNHPVSIQVCALGYNVNSGTIQCVDEMIDEEVQKDHSLAVFELHESIHEPFTLNIVPIWEKESHNTYLIIDEIAYIGGCVQPTIKETMSTSTSSEYLTTNVKETSRNTFRPFYSTSSQPEHITTTKSQTSTTAYIPVTYPPVIPMRSSFTISTMSTTTPRYKYQTTTEAPHVDYCKILNCNFNENACNYLNHGLTKAPWTLRTKGYGFPLSRLTDIRPMQPNNQFVSALLSAGDFAILESPKFNGTQGINVLLFQYYRPTHASTIRLCLGTKYTKPLRTVASFTQCPPILRTLTSKNAYKWNTIHIQIPPGTTNFYLVAHNLDRTSEKAAIAIDSIRVALCDPRNFEPLHSEEIYEDSS